MMASETKLYQVDPDGDLVLILHNPNKPFAVWDEGLEPPSALVEPQAQEDTLQGRSRSDSLASMHSSVDQPGEVTQPPSQIRYQLSSKHLMLASKVFKTMLTGNWKEANVKSDGKMHIDTSDWDQEALLVLMNIIHGRNRSEIPRQVEPVFLAKIAVLVDFYQCHEVIEVWFKEIWLPKLTGWVSDSYGRDLMLGLAISWVFKENSAFHTLTRIAILKTRGPIQTMDLPIPSVLLSRHARSSFP